MPFGSYQPVDVLMLVGNVAPIALYFLALGLVNSHARPHLITARTDFVALSTVLVPVLLWPVPNLAHGKAIWLLVAGLAAAGTCFYWLLPARNAGFVIYNVAERRCRQMLDEALAAMGLCGQWQDQVWRSHDGRLVIRVRAISLLRNVSLMTEATPEGRPLVHELGQALEERLRRVAQLPSTMGACLVMLGIGLLVLPMWMVGRHIHDLVDAMSRLFG
jgi:hypothetical protein